MPNNRKIKVSKIKGIEKAHPYSRKADQLRRAYAREERIGKAKSAKDIEKTRAVDRMIWFKYALPDDVPCADQEMLHDLISQYINRNSAEMTTLQSTIRPNRPKPSKLTLLEMLKSKDQQEYNAGITIPDLTDPANVVVLRSFEGDYNALPRIKVISVRSLEALELEEVSRLKKVEDLERRRGEKEVMGMRVD
ncbi:hypothetical protein HDU76_008798 [Blyttiomyces sp. JEL0837]|nr:hypothetical protein HDU76_008798 [Blyttiomyces sp. JEL0837]